MNSHNHPMYGSIGAWFYRRLAGIQVPDDAIGMSRVIIRPPLDLTLSEASATLGTVRGELSSTWRRIDGTAVMDIRIPLGTTADLVLAAGWNLVDARDRSLPAERGAARSGETVYTLDAGEHRLTAHAG